MLFLGSALVVRVMARLSADVISLSMRSLCGYDRVSQRAMTASIRCGLRLRSSPASILMPLTLHVNVETAGLNPPMIRS